MSKIGGIDLMLQITNCEKNLRDNLTNLRVINANHSNHKFVMICKFMMQIAKKKKSERTNYQTTISSEPHKFKLLYIKHKLHVFSLI